MKEEAQAIRDFAAAVGVIPSMVRMSPLGVLNLMPENVYRQISLQEHQAWQVHVAYLKNSNAEVTLLWMADHDEYGLPRVIGP